MQHNTNTERHRLLRVSEVAHRLDVNNWRVYELVREGLIPHVRIGRQVRFDADRLEAWIVRGGTAAADDDRRRPEEVPVGKSLWDEEVLPDGITADFADMLDDLESDVSPAQRESWLAAFEEAGR